MTHQRLICMFALALASSSAGASSPGQLLDCSDWEFFEPGLSCTRYGAWQPECTNETCVTRDPWWPGDKFAVDNTGRILRVRPKFSGTSCGPSSNAMNWIVLEALTNGVWIELARVYDRCNVPPDDRDWMVLRSGSGSDLEYILFDAVRGRVLIGLISRSTGDPDDRWIAAIDGFATLFEILQTYTPPSTISFRVPATPEGLGGADGFDTYWGNLASVGDWSQAQALACGYPVMPPGAGDRLTVADTLPTPPPGQGYYYVTAVSYQGQRRYGRQRAGALLRGRDPAALPACMASTQVGRSDPSPSATIRR